MYLNFSFLFFIMDNQPSNKFMCYIKIVISLVLLVMAILSSIKILFSSNKDQQQTKHILEKLNILKMIIVSSPHVLPVKEEEETWNKSKHYLTFTIIESIQAVS